MAEACEGKGNVDSQGGFSNTTFSAGDGNYFADRGNGFLFRKTALNAGN